MSRQHAFKLHAYRMAVTLLFLALWALAQGLVWALGGNGPVQRMAGIERPATESTAPAAAARQHRQTGSAAESPQRRRQLLW